MEFFFLIALVVLAFPLWVIVDRQNLKRRIERLEKFVKDNMLVAPVAPSHDLSAQEQRMETTSEPITLVEAERVEPVEKTSLSSSLPKDHRDLELLIGQKWLPIIGIIAVIFGASFFLKYAFETDLIGVTGRVILGLLAGLVLVGLGDYWKAKYEKYAWILSGGGIALFYLSIFASFSYYHLVSQTTAFGFMIVVTVFSAALAIRYNAQILAGVGILGGFLTPFLLSTGVDNQIGLFTYLALLNAGIFVLAMYRNWRPLSLLGLVGTMITFAVWYGSFYKPAKLFLTELFLAIFFIEYLFATILGNLFSKRESTKDDLGLLIINAVWFFGWSYKLLEPGYEPYLGVFAALMAAIYIALAYIALTTKKSDKNLGLFLGGIALVFLTLVFPIQFAGRWITFAWAVEASILTYIGFAIASQKVRIFGLLVMLVSIFRLITLDSSTGPIADYTIVFNQRFFIYLVVIASMIIMSVLYLQRFSVETDREIAGEERVASILTAGWNVLLLAILSMEVLSYYGKQIAAVVNTNRLPSGGRVITRGIGGVAQSLANQRNALISVLWGLYATVLLIVGMKWANKGIRLGALVLFGVTIIKVFMVDLANLPTLYRFISFFVLGALLLAGSYLYYRNQSRLSNV